MLIIIQRIIINVITIQVTSFAPGLSGSINVVADMPVAKNSTDTAVSVSKTLNDALTAGNFSGVGMDKNDTIIVRG